MRLLVVSSLLASLLVCPVARADEPPPTDVSAAQALFDAGRELMESGHPVEACAKFEESNKLDPSAGTLLNLGQCLEAQNKTASAWGMYKKAVSLGRSTGKERHVEKGEEFIAAIEPRLVKLTIVTESPAPPDLAIVRTDASGATVSIANASLGIPIAVDPSTYSIEAREPGHETWSKTVKLEQAGETVVKVPALPRTVAPPPPLPPPRAPLERQPLFVGGLATAGAGLIGLAIGTAYGVMTLDDAALAEADPKLCPKHHCTPRGEAFVEDARTKSYVSSATLALGGVAVAAGGVMIGWAVAHRHDPAPPAHAGGIVVLPLVSMQGRGWAFGFQLGSAL